MTDTKDLKTRFWNHLAESPYVFLQRDADVGSAVPMTAQLDVHANHAIWFFSTKDSHLAKGGSVTATFTARHHDLFARFSGVLSHELSQERLDALWTTTVSAWYPGGKEDPSLLLLRMDLGGAEIWNNDLGLIDSVKLLLGIESRDEPGIEHVQTRL
ncbi:general stress protein [Altererythrobacter xixiisoli]|uniref:General stress protein n=1 Tax=Croceibacterium xixiisoli TaxID=1476466 RepID=A0A6I4TZM5_9SPHN|nr:pyridoxamine 5'-phosphate oxidase family protein [Croceibacterium xixiisoli]MXO99813.1 general stress protein [Croceibacterium xixiisoli]